jgi:hypothetical protein
MMGLPDGWVTAVPGVPRNAQLKALGNGVVPQQAASALRILLERADTDLYPGSHAPWAGDFDEWDPRFRPSECGDQLFAGPARGLRTVTTVPVAGGVL